MGLLCASRCSASSTFIQVLIETSSTSEAFFPSDRLILRRMRRAVIQAETVVTIVDTIRISNLIRCTRPPHQRPGGYCLSNEVYALLGGAATTLHIKAAPSHIF